MNNVWGNAWSHSVHQFENFIVSNIDISSMREINDNLNITK